MSLETQKVALARITKIEGGMSCWPSNRKVKAGYDPQLVQEYCVQDEEWQKCRLSMKGKPTHKKLEMLRDWWDDNYDEDSTKTELQVGNYLGALRRGHQLDANNVVEKWL